MSSQVSAPVTITGIAMDVTGEEPAMADAATRFESVAAVARSLGYVSQDVGRPNLVLALSPDAPIASCLQQIADICADFNTNHAPLHVRMVAHHGVSFRTESDGQVSYVGSAIRSAQSALRRAPASGHLMATRDFVTYAATIAGLPFRIEAIGGGMAVEGMSQLIFGSISPVHHDSDELTANDAAFDEFIKRRLAEDIGPFSSALVDRAKRSTTALQQLIEAMAHEIDKPDARTKFEADVKHYVESRAKH